MFILKLCYISFVKRCPRDCRNGSVVSKIVMLVCLKLKSLLTI
jgi:hypothetical protein